MIRQASIEDLPRLQGCAEEFYASSRHLKGFNLGHFCHSWEILLSQGSGVILIDERGPETAGAIGGIAFPDINNGEMTAAELFWFTRPRFRGAGVRLYRAFIEWANGKGATTIQMIHLLDSMPEKVADFYRREGYEAVETLYVKRLAA